MADLRGGSREIGRAMSMADAAPNLSATPRSQMGSAFQDGDGTFDANYSKIAGSAAAGGTSSKAAGGGSSSSRKPGRCVVCCVNYAYVRARRVVPPGSLPTGCFRVWNGDA